MGISTFAWLSTDAGTSANPSDSLITGFMGSGLRKNMVVQSRSAAARACSQGSSRGGFP